MWLFRRTPSLEDCLAQTVRIAGKWSLYSTEVAEPDRASLMPNLYLPGAATTPKDVLKLLMLSPMPKPNPGSGNIVYVALTPQVLVLGLHSVSSQTPIALPNDHGTNYRNPEFHVTLRQYADGTAETVANSFGYEGPMRPGDGIAKQLRQAKKAGFGKKAEILLGALVEMGNSNPRQSSTNLWQF
ncbi:hypothetical protein HYU16_01390 [Candidatus Woesearchaeota archaeon]|nr:hypothetical protein [Candidatus Woesearchaeota archaeon]